ncbi:hypothetical protein WA026_009662 [Henosepilachna vigintioctopunctata]|uniref:Uncharacterized protein n=1 Tax=Henosepilachna vigintioctopunctata TaxID=420089 RepID=A0AAW1U019_9CUCU
MTPFVERETLWVLQIHDTIAHTELGKISKHARPIVHYSMRTLQYVGDMCGQISQDVVNVAYQRVMDFIRGANHNQAPGRRRSRGRNSQRRAKRRYYYARCQEIFNNASAHLAQCGETVLIQWTPKTGNAT